MSPAIDLQESVLSKIGGTATANGIVTLTGSVSTYMEKLGRSGQQSVSTFWR